MTDLSPTTAFGLTSPRVAQFPAVTIAEVTNRCLASLAVSGNASEVLNTPLAQAGTFCTKGALTTIWTGPDQWLIEDTAPDSLCARLTSALPDAAVTDQTDGWVVLDVTTKTPEAMHSLLEKLVNIDLSRFGTGAALRTGLHHMSVFVVRRSATSLTIMGMRSAAGSVWHAVSTAAAAA